MDNNNNDIYITGAAGWLGKALVNALLNGIDGLDNLPKAGGKVKLFLLPNDDSLWFSKFGERVEIIRGDLRNKVEVKSFLKGSKNAMLYHTAGIIHPNKIKDFYDINVEGTKNLLHEAEIQGVRRAVIVSSNSPIGCNPTSEHRFDESSPYNPYMNYGLSKKKMEEIAEDFHQRGCIETVIIRAPWFYGPFQPPRQTLFFRMIKEGKGPIIGHGNNMRSMAYIDNLAQGLILAANTKKASGKIYWIADERAYSMNEIYNTIEKVLEDDFSINCKNKRIRLPGIISDVAYIFDKLLQSVGLYHQKIHVLSEMNKNIACEIALAKKELGYQPTVSLEVGMKNSIRQLLDDGEKI